MCTVHVHALKGFAVCFAKEFAGWLLVDINNDKQVAMYPGLPMLGKAWL